MAFSPAAAQTAAKYLRGYLEPGFPPDAEAAAQPGFDPAILPPIDGALVWMRRAHPELVSIFQKLGEQRRSRTDIGDQRIFDRIPGLRYVAGWLRRALAATAGGSRTMKSQNVAFGKRSEND